MGLTESKYSENYKLLIQNYKEPIESSNPSIGGFYLYKNKYYNQKFALEKQKKLPFIENLEEASKYATIYKELNNDSLAKLYSHCETSQTTCSDGTLEHIILMEYS